MTLNELKEISKKPDEQNKQELHVLWKHTVFKISHILVGIWIGITIVIHMESIRPFRSWWYPIIWVSLALASFLSYQYSKDMEQIIHEYKETIAEMLQHLDE